MRLYMRVSSMSLPGSIILSRVPDLPPDEKKCFAAHHNHNHNHGRLRQTMESLSQTVWCRRVDAYPIITYTKYIQPSTLDLDNKFLPVPELSHPIFSSSPRLRPVFLMWDITLDMPTNA